MNARFLTQRLALLLTVAMLSQVVTSESLAQSEQAAPPQQSITVGKLIRSGRTQNGKPKFALLDAEGNITGYVVPAAGLNLSPYVNQEVGVTARASKQGSDGLPYILAQNATPLSGTGNDTTLSSGKSRGTADDVFSDEELEFALDEKPSSSPAARSYPARPAANEPQLLPIDRSFQQLGANRMRDGQISRTNMQMPYEGEVIVDDSGMGMPFHGSSCGDPGCTSCGGGYGGCTVNTAGPCGPSGHFWARAEYLLWWTKGMNVPPLVTTSPGTALPQNAGVLGQDTSVLYGDGDILDNARNGGRFRIGKWWDACQGLGIEAEYIILGEESDEFLQSSSGSPILARPFINSQTGQDSELVAYPGIVTGTIGINSSSEFQSLAPRFRMNLCCFNACASPADACSGCNSCGGVGCYQPATRRLDLLLGYRYLGLDESLTMREQLVSSLNNTSTSFDLFDSFRAENEFHGGEVGLAWEKYQGPWSLEVLGRLAMGNNRRIVTISGSTTSASGGTTFQDQGGLLAQSSNIGRYTSDTFAVIPEVDLTLGYQIATNLRFLFGYSFLYWDAVSRPGDAIDLTVNPNLIPPATANPGVLRPRFAFNESSFWAQGLSFGFDLRW